MAIEYRLSYTASDINQRLGKIDNLASKDELPTKTSDLINDSDYLTSYTETDPTVPAWAKASTKPSYTKSEVGLGNVDNVKQYSAINPPPYPVESVNGKTGVISLSASEVGALPADTVIPTVPTNVSAFTNDVGYLTEHQSLDGLATEDYVDEHITTAITESVADWNQSDETAPDYIKNKPTDYVSYGAQSLTEEQKQQVQDNIGFSEDDALSLVTELNLVSLAAAEDGSIYTDENGALYSL